MISTIEELAGRRAIAGQPIARATFFDGGVYVIGFRDYVKIGRTGSFPSRVKTLQAFLPEKLVIYGTILCPNEYRRTAIEKQLHKRFKEYPLNGEWFRKEGELADWIAARCPLLLE
jgi:hypothetical protein